MTDRYSIGVDVIENAAQVVAVNVRDGMVERDWRERVSVDQIIGIGFAQPSESPTPEQLGLPRDIPIARARSAGHASVPGAGIASPSTMLMILDPVSRFFMNSRTEAKVQQAARGAADSILPGYFGYEFAPLEGLASDDRKTVESAALELRRCIHAVRAAGVQVRRFVACGQIARKSPATMQLLADVLDARIKPASSDEPALLGAAILGALAAGVEATGHASMSQVIHAMAPRRASPIFRPDIRRRTAFPPPFGRGQG